MWLSFTDNFAKNFKPQIVTRKEIKATKCWLGFYTLVEKFGGIDVLLVDRYNKRHEY